MSRAIDAMVAEKVMGWTPDEYGCWSEGTHQSHGGRVRWCKADSEGLDRLNDAEVWSPSTDPAAYTEVIDYHATGYVEIHNGWGERDGERVGGWKCRIVVPGGEGEAREPTIGMAVCIAALRAVGVAEDEIQKARGK